MLILRQHMHYLFYLIFEKSSSTKWMFNMQKSISKLIFAGYTGSKNPVRNRLKKQFIELDFSKIKYRWIGVRQDLQVPGLAQPLLLIYKC